MIDKIKGGIIVSCYAGNDYPGDINAEMANPIAMAYVANSVVAGGAAAIRTNLANLKAVREMVSVPVIGIHKVSDENNPGDFRITPTMKEVDELVKNGADGIAIDGTKRPRYDDLTLEEFIHQIKAKYPDLLLIADISTVEEGIAAYQYGADMVGTTLSGYTPYSKNPIVFGTIPTPEPDYDIIRELKKHGIENIIAEGRYHSGEQLMKGFEAGATAIVVGTSITSPKKIVQTLLYDAKQAGGK
ncbi:MAG: N-acetylmannosamine-6-phosphate 2-epimerase [Erysipelotrichaceae bacterium]|nr:N-acetylmannosamine-6-phosphate 2-epimerase [Erysipelotrichaceae bacterium]